MKPPIYDNDLIQTLQLSGEYIGRSDQAEKRADWILFLIDEVKGFISDDEYAALLEKLNGAVATLQEEAN